MLAVCKLVALSLYTGERIAVAVKGEIAECGVDEARQRMAECVIIAVEKIRYSGRKGRNSFLYKRICVGTEQRVLRISSVIFVNGCTAQRGDVDNGGEAAVTFIISRKRRGSADT